MVDIGRIGRFCRKKGLLFVVDASQTAGVFDINMEEMGIDVLCFTGHKGLLGPQGTGGICVRQGVAGDLSLWVEAESTAIQRPIRRICRLLWRPEL